MSESKVWVFSYDYKNEDENIHIHDYLIFKNKMDAFAAMYKRIGENISTNYILDNWIKDVNGDSVKFYEDGYYNGKHSNYRVEEKLLR